MVFAAAHADEATPVATAPPARIEQSSGAQVLPGEYYRSCTYQGVDPVTGQGSLMWRYGEGTGLFSSQPGDAGQSWSVSYRSGLPRYGVEVGFSATEADRGLVGGQALGVAAGETGLRRADYSASWKGRSFSLKFDGGRAADTLFGAGLGRENVSVSALGAWYSRERLAIDETLRLESAAHDRLLGKDGYGLGSRRLGTGGGFSNLNALSGLRDDYQAFGYSRGRFSVSSASRELDRYGARLSDTTHKLSYGALALSRVERSVGQDVSWLREAGYGSLSGLRGGRSTDDTVAVNLAALTASWSRSQRLVDSSPSASEERRVALRPWQGIELGYSHKDVFGGSPSAADDVSLSVARGRHSLSVEASSELSGAPSDSEVLRRLEASYQMGRALTLRYSGQDSALPGAEDAARRAVHNATIETGAGLLAKGRIEYERDRLEGLYYGAQLERKLVEWWSVGAAYDAWADTSDSGFQIAGRRRVLAGGVDDAAHYRVSTTVKPGRAELGAEHRVLTWRQPGDSSLFRAGAHSLAESSVKLTQPLLFGLQARGAWSLTECDTALDSERREASVAFAPRGRTLLEMGYREGRSGGGAFSPTAFVSATLRPWGGLTMQGEVIQDAGQAKDWLSDERRTLRISATHAYLGSGEAKVAYSRTPGDLSAGAAAVTPGQELVVDLATPSDFVFDGLRLSGRWRNARAAGEGVQAMVERSASLSWEARWLGALKATYTDSEQAGTAAGSRGSRVSVEYSRALGDSGKVVLSGWLDDVLRRMEYEAVREKYRLGVRYELPF